MNMKKTMSLLLALVMTFSLAACGSQPAETPDTSDTPPAESSSQQPEEQTPSAEQTPTEDQETADTTESGKSLVVYFSMPETTDPDNMTQEEDNSVVVIDGEVLGNTQYVAYVIQENIGADIFRIEPETPYPTDHDTLVDLAAEEQDNNARPAIKDSIENLEQYDTIFIGYPNWWGDMPMILYSFFDQYDFSSKTIVPFNTHGGSGFSNTISTIAELEPSAEVNEDGFTVSRNNVQEAEQDIISWLNDLGYTK
jgi:flavodoxin/predicted small lipoprotein YifL